MHTMPKIRHWMHLMHDGSVKIAHYSGHLLHEKAFWAFLGIFALLVLFFSLLLLLGNETVIDYRAYPYPMP